MASQNQPAAGLRLRDLVGQPDDGLLREVYETILEPSFPPDELDSLDNLRAQIADGSVRFAVTMGSGGDVTGAVMANWFPRSRSLLLSYLAIRPGLRGGGLGTRLVGATVPAWAREFGPVLGLIEVEDPRRHEVSPHGDPQARLRFYVRLGARVLDVPYFQPRVSPDSERVGDMLLMAFIADSSPAFGISGHAVDSAALAGFLDEYFEDAEGPQVLCDPDYTALRGAVTRAAAVPLLGAAETTSFRGA